MDSSNSSLLRLPHSFFNRLTTQLRSQSTTTNALVATSSFLAIFTAWLYTDYRAWLAFGTGGTPSTPSGYWRMTKIRLARLLSTDNLRDPKPLNAHGESYLKIALPKRPEVDRPRVQSRTMPQRQHPTQPPLSAEVKERIYNLCKNLAAQYPNLLTLAPSAVEGYSADAIYALPSLPNRPASASDKILKNEIAHAHQAEDSLHVWLSEADARKVVESGWGERFPLAAEPLKLLHPGLTFVYAPRGGEGAMEDVQVIEEIVKAGVRYVTGGEVL